MPICRGKQNIFFYFFLIKKEKKKQFPSMCFFDVWDLIRTSHEAEPVFLDWWVAQEGGVFAAGGERGPGRHAETGEPLPRCGADQPGHHAATGQGCEGVSGVSFQVDFAPVFRLFLGRVPIPEKNSTNQTRMPVSHGDPCVNQPLFEGTLEKRCWVGWKPRRR